MTAVKSTWKPYPAYKPSGTEWLGEVPEQWEVKRIRHVALLKSGESITASEIDTDGEYPVYGGNGLRGYTAGYSHDGHYALIGRQGALCGNINYARGKFWASEHAVVVRPLVPFETVWMGELLRAMNLNQYSVSAAQPGLSVDTVSALKIPVPHQAEQRAIASFLDRETGKIDRLAAKNRELIEKLKEERAALISRAVTRGLNAGAAFKPSGVEWLGDVPKGWDVRRSDRIIETERRQIPPSKFAGIEVFHYSIPAVQEHGTGILENGDDVASGKQRVTEPVVMVSRLNPRKATVCRAEPQGALTIASTEFVALKARKCDLRFLEHLVNTEPFRQRLDSWVQSVTRSHQRVSPEHIYRFWNAWPDPVEQCAIADFLDRETGRIDRLAAKVEEAIGRLQEYRAALITAAVTGKIDVRQAGALEYPEAAPALLKAAESGARYGGKNTDGHGLAPAGRKR